MMNYQKYVTVFLVAIGLLILFHFTVWNLYTKHVLLVHTDIYTGDLGRLSMYSGTSYPRQAYPSKKSVNLKKEHMDFETYRKGNNSIDILTIGDSFSNGAMQGTNPFYQDYIATVNDYNVLNIHQLSGTANYLETLLVLNNNGLLDKIHPHSIIVESVERFCIDRFALEIDTSVDQSYDNVIRKFNRLKNPYLSKDENINFINDQNFKALKFNILYHFNDRAFTSNVYKVELKKDFFTSRDKDQLLFFNEDLEHIPKATKLNMKRLNDNFNKVAEILKKKKIKLYFMPVVDKYNMYRRYQKSKDYPESIFFEQLRELKKEYKLIDTKAILSKELEKGVKDLYYPDDTHWSYKASEALFKKMKF